MALVYAGSNPVLHPMEEKIKEIVEKVTEREVTDVNSPIYMDSIDFMDIIVEIENLYNITLDISELNRTPSIKELTSIVWDSV